MVKRQAAAEPAAAGDSDRENAPSPEEPVKEGEKAGGAEKAEPVFEENEVVLARDSGKLYDAKIVRVLEANVQNGGQRQYFIHYVGWKSKWDKWVNPSELLKATEENKKKQRELNDSKKRAATTDAAATKAEIKKKRAVEMDKDIEEDGLEAPVKVAMPFTLKKQLVDDWEMITREPHQLVPLPREPSASHILNAFLEQKREKSNTSAAQLQRFQELIEGIRMYFDKALPLILLYRQEREQYDRLRASAGKDFVPSEVYGAEHLLRLFVRLPHLLAQTAMSQQEVSQVQTKLADFMKFLQKNYSQYFLTLYKKAEEVCPPNGGAAAPAPAVPATAAAAQPTPMDVAEETEKVAAEAPAATAVEA